MLKCFVYIAVAKDCWEIKLEELKSDQKDFAKKMRKSWKPQKLLETVRKLFN